MVSKIVRICLMIVMAGVSAYSQLKTITVGGPWSDYPTLPSALASLPNPLTNDVRIVVELGDGGFITPGFTIDNQELGSTGYFVIVEGKKQDINSSQNEASFYVGNEIEYRVAPDNSEQTILSYGAEARQVITNNGTSAPSEFHIRDHLGSVITTVPDDGDQHGDLFEYDAYGRQEILSVSTSAKLSQAFTGKEYDIFDPSDANSAGLYHFGARSYDPDVGIWISPDPLGQFNSPYAYSTTPVNTMDPNGMVVETPWDAANVAMGVASISVNVATGNVPGVIVDGVGLVYDGVATVWPGLPGGASSAINAARAGKITQKVREAAKYGVEVHEKYQLALGKAYDYNVRMLKSIRRPDAINEAKRIVRELKPDTPSGIRKGKKQLQEYIDHLNKVYPEGERWKGFLDFYKPKK